MEWMVYNVLDDYLDVECGVCLAFFLIVAIPRALTKTEHHTLYDFETNHCATFLFLSRLDTNDKRLPFNIECRPRMARASKHQD